LPSLQSYGWLAARISEVQGSYHDRHNYLITYATVVLGLFLIPGPAVLLTLARATAGGRRVGIATGLGIAAGDLVHTLMASFGLSAVLMTSAIAFDVVKFAGAATAEPAVKDPAPLPPPALANAKLRHGYPGVLPDTCLM
jgi:hypothetical protein